MKMRVETMSSDSDPWHQITVPSDGSIVAGRRVDPKLSWDIFWAIDKERRCLLVIRHIAENKPTQKLPQLRGLEVEMHPQTADGDCALVIRLLDSKQRELFYRLCLDIVSASEKADSEKQAVALVLARTWRWHRLLRVGYSGLLSEKEQKGLIGELRVLQTVLFPAVGIASAIRAWKGPLGAPKDFEVGALCIESKSHSGAATPYIEISSEHQLGTEDIESLYLYVLEVAAAADESHDSVTLNEAVASILEEVNDDEPRLLICLEEKLLASGFEFEHDYSDFKWRLGLARLFEVGDGFPRVASGDLRAGVHQVRYRIALSNCQDYEFPVERLQSRLRDTVQ